jgi:hypothetical protein
MADFSHTRKWWPSVFLDESMPAGRDKPEDWLAPDEDGVSEIRDADFAKGQVFATVRPGETIEFAWHENRGSVDILLMPDGSWKPLGPHDCGTIDLFEGERPVPTQPMADIDGANWFAWDEDYESTCGTMDEFAHFFAEIEPPEPEGRRVRVDMGHWSDPVTFRISADGKSLEKADA